MDRPGLTDPEQFPEEEVLSGCLGKVKGTWDSFVALLGEADPGMAGEWRYYRDGKSWLYKVTNKKTTVCWVSVVNKAFKVAFYFPDRAEELITASTLMKEYVDQFVHGKRYGTTRSLTVTVKKAGDLQAIRTLIEIKRQLK